MIVDTDLLRMGADYSNSAASIVQRGAAQFAATQLRSGIFGEFDAADSFQAALCTAHRSHVELMNGHYSELGSLAEKATIAASTFVAQDAAASRAVTAACNSLP